MKIRYACAVLLVSLVASATASATEYGPRCDPEDRRCRDRDWKSTGFQAEPAAASKIGATAISAKQTEPSSAGEALMQFFVRLSEKSGEAVRSR